MYKLKVILGSVRPTRFSEKVVPWVLEGIKKHPEFEADVLDLKDFELPFFNEAETPSSKKEAYKHPAVAAWTAKIADGDAYIFITPEYDRGYPGVLKNAIDWVYPEWNNKPAAFVAYGTVGGARAVEQLRLVAVELQMAPIRQAVHIPAHWTLLDEKGELRTGALDSHARSAETMLSQLSWWTGALKIARSS